MQTAGKGSISFFLYFIYPLRELNLRSLTPLFRLIKTSWLKKKKLQFLNWNVVVVKVKLVERIVSVVTAIVLSQHTDRSSYFRRKLTAVGDMTRGIKWFQIIVSLVRKCDQKVSVKWYIYDASFVMCMFVGFLIASQMQVKCPFACQASVWGNAFDFFVAWAIAHVHAFKVMLFRILWIPGIYTYSVFFNKNIPRKKNNNNRYQIREFITWKVGIKVS